jgi:formylglycine-generating enzyme required for sulfatase activity
MRRQFAAVARILPRVVGFAGLAACAIFSVAASAVTVPRPVANSPAAVAATLQMVKIRAGDFVMGTDPSVSFQNGFPPHRVSIRTFFMSRYDVTFEQYDAFARATHRPLPPDEGWGRGDRPVIHVSWQDAHAFIDWLNRGTGRHFRLPSEAEWEYAARGGTTTLYWWGDEPDPDKANTVTNLGRDHFRYTSPVGSFPANPFGLYDMSGNVWQFAEDCRHGSFDGAPTDGRPWLGNLCDSRVVRGGSYASIRRGMQVAARAAAGETFDSAELGMRLAEDR